MDRYQHVGDFAPEEEPWASDIPHHPPQTGPHPVPAPRIGLVQQLPLPQEGLGHVNPALPIGPPQIVPVPSPPDGAAPSAFMPQPPHAASGLTASQQHREYMKAKRRVPASQRKRTQVSCDACKTRRCKCIRLGTGAGSDDESNLPPCKLCTDNRILCVTTMPRKQRVYGSVENLDKRYRSLEALVAGLFPNLNPRSSADELVVFGRGVGIKMPNFGNSPEQAKLSIAGLAMTSPSSTASDRGLSYLPPDSVKPERGHSILPPAYFTKNAPMVPQLFPRLPNDRAVDPEDGCSGLIVDAGGRPHYIGPSGTLAFLGDVRILVSHKLNSRGGPQGMGWQDQGSRRGVESIIIEKVTGSLGGSTLPPESGRISSSRAQRIFSTGTHIVEGDEQPLIRHESDVRASNDPNYWRCRRLASMIDLPPREQADACVEAYFRHVHPNFILFHHSTFHRAYQTLWRVWGAAREGIQDKEVKELTVTTSWLLCLYMIFIFGSRSLPQVPTSLAFQRKWHGEIERLPSLLRTASLVNVCGHSKQPSRSLSSCISKGKV